MTPEEIEIEVQKTSRLVYWITGISEYGYATNT
jgi:hypothetical protein